MRFVYKFLKSYEWGLSARSVDLKCMWEPHSYRKTALLEHDNTRGKQTRLYFKWVTISKSKLKRSESVRDALRILLLWETICFQSKWCGACNFV